MRHIFTYLILVFCTVFSGSAQDLSGRWSGFIIMGGQTLEKANVMYLDIQKNGDEISGLSRIELFENDVEFAVKSFKGKQTNNQLKITEDFVKRSSKTRLSPECKLEYELTYDSKTGYLKGKFSSSECRNMVGEMVFFRSDHEVNIEKVPTSTHFWRHTIIRNYKKGYPAPEILKIEQAEFKFEAIHFDYDEAVVRPEYFDYLKRMARVLDAVHDLRVKITGHTDGDGSDDYNLKLSERRADALRDFFKTQGIDAEKLEIDFKGKREPIDSNKTQEGKQNNRRVVFEFI